MELPSANGTRNPKIKVSPMKVKVRVYMITPSEVDSRDHETSPRTSMAAVKF